MSWAISRRRTTRRGVGGLDGAAAVVEEGAVDGFEVSGLVGGGIGDGGVEVSAGDVKILLATFAVLGEGGARGPWWR